MLQRKKLEYYAKQNGIEDIGKVKLTEDDCVKLCNAVGVPLHHAADFGGDFTKLVSIVMDEPAFIDSHRKDGVSDEVLLIRCGDYAAMELFKAYSEMTKE